MSEEQQESGLSTLKKTIIGIATTAVTAAGAYVTTHIEQLFGVEEEVPTEQVESVAAPVEQKAEQNVNVSGPEIIINIPEQKAPAPTRVIERVVEKPVEPAKKVEESEEDPW